MAASPRPLGGGGRLDLYREHAAEYRARAEPAFVDVGPARYLALDGVGAPGGREFQDAAAALYNAAFTIRMQSKAAGRDYAVPKLEALWWADPATPDGRRWRVLMRVPQFIGAADLDRALELLGRRGRDRGAVRLVDMEEGRCVQALHVGPYAEEPATIERMRAFAAEHGLRLCGAHHEIYVSDPRRVPPPRLRTILRRPVCEE